MENAKRWKTRELKLEDPVKAFICGASVKSVVLVSVTALKLERMCSWAMRPQSRKQFKDTQKWSESVGCYMSVT